jgi:mannosylglycerate hydrolase MGH1-like protein
MAEPAAPPLDPERQRIAESTAGTVEWDRWGPYLADRQWGTVREDYSADGDAWRYLPHDHARSRAYRWGEDGLLGICDRHGWLNFAIALWNERDPILKERLFGLTGPEGNHGEDVKEAYFYLDATPTASYLRALYKYPQAAFPYQQLVDESARRGREVPEYELRDTGVFAEDRYFDVEVEYAKASADDIGIRIRATNRGPDEAPLHLLGQLWFRNTWAWGIDPHEPTIQALPGDGVHLRADHHSLGATHLTAAGEPEILFTENESNAERLWDGVSRSRTVKDAFHEAIVHGNRLALAGPGVGGSKAAAHHAWTIPAGETREAHLRLTRGRDAGSPAAADVDAIVEARRGEADAFYASVTARGLNDDERLVQRQAFAGLIWGKQYYHIDVAHWLDGDPSGPPPPVGRNRVRNAAWRELDASDVISMPDPWEYPWFAAWDLGFHTVPLALIDPEFAKRQLVLLTREWYMHPNGQLPAYEWSFDDVNPPVHAWAAWRVYKIDRRVTGRADRAFLEKVFHKLLLNFTWWVNRKDHDGNNVFQGGFLGLDNIGVFDRSATLPDGGQLNQADATAWMGFYSLQMLQIALELARENAVYEDVASKFFEHFLFIGGALNNLGGAGISLWDEDDQFFYDVLQLPSGQTIEMKVRSIVGLLPLLAVETLDADVFERFPGFARRLGWFLRNRPTLAGLVASWEQRGVEGRRLLALVEPARARALLGRMLDESEFLSPYGIRGLSRYHLDHPYAMDLDGVRHEIRYEPAESQTGLFGGNSNWRGPVWFPINYLLIEALQKYHHYLGDDIKAQMPAGSGNLMNLREVGDELARRLIALFARGPDGRRPVFGDDAGLQEDPLWRDHVLFYEYFDGDTGKGLGASHQTGWTALVAKLLDQVGRSEARRTAAAAPEQAVTSRGG